MSSSVSLANHVGDVPDAAIRGRSALPPAVARVDWGRTEYAESTQRQLEIWAKRTTDEIPDTLIFTEHDSVFTLGVRPGAGSHLVWDEAQLRNACVTVEQSSRGGDITYHGPGQIVGYPIVSLRPHPDLHAYLRFLEDVLIATVAAHGLEAQRRAGLTGIWIGTRKIGAIGIAVKRWVAYHGFALNVNLDLGPFAGIVPCGISPAHGSVTSLARELGRPLELKLVQEKLFEEFTLRWDAFLRAGKNALVPRPSSYPLRTIAS